MWVSIRHASADMEWFDQLRSRQRAREGVHGGARPHDPLPPARPEDRRPGRVPQGLVEDRGASSMPTTSRRATRSPRASTSSSTSASSTSCDRAARARSTSPTSSSWPRSTRSTTPTPTGWEPTAKARRAPTGCCSRRWRRSSRSAIGTVVMRNKQYLAAIRPLDGALAMSTMRFADEVVAAHGDRRRSRAPASKPTDRELRLATQIDRLADDRLGPGALRTTPTPMSSRS